MTTNPTYDETRPHPWVDPVQPNGSLTHQAVNGIPHITIRNPIKRMRKGVRDGNIDWQATALDLAANLHATSIALEVSRELIDRKNSFMEKQAVRNQTLDRKLTKAWKYLCQIRITWWWRWFASAPLKSNVNELLGFD